MFPRNPPDLLNGLHGAEDVAGVGQDDQPRSKRDSFFHFVWLDGAAAVGSHARQRDVAGQFHCAQRPTDAVVFEVGGDHVIAVGQHALDGHIERVGRVEREDKALWLLAVEKLVQLVPAVVEGAFGG